MLLSCGSNSFSHLALGHNEDVSTLTATLPTAPGEILDLVSVSAHTLLLVRDNGRNALYGVGTNTFGQLGRQCALRDEEDKQVLKEWRRLDLIGELDEAVEGDWEPIKIGATWTTSFVVYRRLSSDQSSDDLSTKDMVIACGSNDFNELGYTDPTTSRTAPVTSASPPRQVEIGLPPGEKVEHLACGQRHIMLVVSDNGGRQKVVGWGAGRRGELDMSTMGGVMESSSRKGKGKGVARPTTYPPTTLDLPLDEGEFIIDISLGASHSLVLTSNRKVLAWGSNQKGQITSTSQLTDIKSISASWGGSYFTTSTNEILSQGSNIYSQLLHISDGRAPINLPDGWKVEKVVAGSEHLLCLLERNGEMGLWVGGWNEHGNLGLGDLTDRAELTRLQVDGSIKGIWGGCASTWVSVE